MNANDRTALISVARAAIEARDTALDAWTDAKYPPHGSVPVSTEERIRLATAAHNASVRAMTACWRVADTYNPSNPAKWQQWNDAADAAKLPR
jgi:hypothetical protein